MVAAGVDSPAPTLSELESDADRRATLRLVGGTLIVSGFRAFLQEEHAYWSHVRPSILEEHKGRWVAVVGGKLVATGAAMNKVLELNLLHKPETQR